MHELYIKDLNTFNNYFKKLGDGFLFRGQCKSYIKENGKPSIPTSQNRQGCIPSLHFKWNYYASEIHRVFDGPQETYKLDLDIVQALLQHYGWRSFFIDLTSDYKIAAWFALNKINTKNIISLSEDFNQTPVKTKHVVANCEMTNHEGHIYVIDIKRIQQLGFKSFNLSEIRFSKNTRIEYQSAWLAGSFKSHLPTETVYAHLTVYNDVLKQIIENSKITTMNSVFPDRNTDKILSLLLTVPFVANNYFMGSPLYERSLNIPEYDFKREMNYPKNLAFYQTGWISDNYIPKDTPLYNSQFFRIPDSMFYVQFEIKDLKFPLLSTLLKTKTLAFETEGLISYPEFCNSYEYGKGIFISIKDNTHVEVSEISVDHPGAMLTGSGINRGWFYNISNDFKWTKIKHPDECPCNNINRHQKHIITLSVIEDMLAEGKFHEKENYYQFVDQRP